LEGPPPRHLRDRLADGDHQGAEIPAQGLSTRRSGRKRMTSPAASARGVALVTGAAGGLGQAIVRTLAAEGYRVVAVDLQPVEAAEVVASHVCDLTDFDAVRAMLDAVIAEVGVPSVLINNAAYYRSAPFFDLSMEQVA